MKVLYAFQGTGNGHTSRALELLPELFKMADTDVMVSGRQHQLKLPFAIKYQFRGVAYVNGRNGGLSWSKSLCQLGLSQFMKDLHALPIKQYDLIINDFEPISAWAGKLKGIPVLGLSHQAAFLSPKSPRPEKKQWIAEKLFHHYAPVDHFIGFHFEKFDQNIELPVLRKLIRQSEPENHGHFTVYLPAYRDQQIIRLLTQLTEIRWQLFSTHCKAPYRFMNIQVFPVSTEGFTNSLINAAGLLCGAGFESPAEALYLGKKLLVIPMKGQYEQACNAAALKKLGVKVIPELNDTYFHQIQEWVQSRNKIRFEYPDETNQILERSISLFKSKLQS